MMPKPWSTMLVAIALCALVALPGCAQGAGSNGEGGETPSSAGEAVSADNSREAYAAARKAIDTEYPDALLVSVSTQGVALADIPSSWNFLFLTPSDKHLRRVAVDHGTAQPIEDVGEAQVEFDPATAVEFDSIKVAAAEAVELARAFAEKSGEVPANVMAGGSFLNAPGAEDIGFTPGSWSVTFIEGTSTEGSRGFRVDMNTGEVTPAEDESSAQ